MQDDLSAYWDSLAGQCELQNPGVERGKMMSADALKWRGKVIAFYATKGGLEGLGCRLGRDFDIASLGLGNWQYLAPFKTKPPMKDWIVAGAADQARWPELIATALHLAQKKRA